MLADTDAGNVVTAAQSGAQWGYRLLPLLIVLIPLLYMVQELTVRLGIYTGQGHGELIRKEFGTGWSWVAAAGLVAATVGSMVTEFTGVAGIGELYGLSRIVTLPIAVTALVAIALSGSCRRVERMTLLIGLFELSFFAVAWMSRPDPSIIARHSVDFPIGNPDFAYLVTAVIGAVFNPWMIFYQQSAVADKMLTPEDHRAARLDTAFGAILTQLLTASILVAVAATVGNQVASPLFNTVGDISKALVPSLGEHIGRLVFSIGVLGASMVAAIVASLGMSWGLGEVAGYRRSLELRPLQAPWFYAVYVFCVIGSAILVCFVPDLVWLNISAQVANAFMLPLVLGFLIALAARALPEQQRLRGAYLWILAIASAIACGLGLFGGVSAVL